MPPLHGLSAAGEPPISRSPPHHEPKNDTAEMIHMLPQGTRHPEGSTNMRGSPFEVFRRNQRQLMVVLTGLAMFSFIFLDVATMRQGGTPVSTAVIVVAVICAGGLWLIGAPRGKGMEFALWGALVGAVVGFVAFTRQSSTAVAQTSIGNFSRNDLQRLAQRRGTANRFVSMASKGSAPLFGGVDDKSLVLRALLLSEAKRRGVKISDDGVNEFIQKITANRLSLPDYKRILSDLGLPEADLFDVLREELAAQLVLQMDLPPQRRFGSGAPQTPLSYWKQFQMLNLKQSLDVVEIPVAAFVAQVPEPKDDELVRLFDMYKNQLPTSDGKPGFLRDRRVQLAYLAADFESFEKLAGEPTDAEIAAYYEEHKERYRVLPELPGGATARPDEPLSPEFAEDQPPVSALQPANSPVRSETPQTPPPPALPEDNGAGACDGPENAGISQPASANTNQPESAGTSRSEGAEPPANPSADDASKTTPQVPEQSTEQLTLPPPAGRGDALPGQPPAPSEPKYRELDDALKLEIRDAILRQKAFARMAEAADRALEEMTKLAEDYLNAAGKEDPTALAERLSKQLQAYAEKHHLQYVETKPMTQKELQANADEPIGSAFEPSSNPFGRSATVANEVFANDVLYYPRRADSFLGKSYAYWKIADTPARVPEFKEVKSEVGEAWKFDKARLLAQQRAEQLADLARKSGKPLGEALAGQTVTGAADAEVLTVKQTPKFSWLSVPRNVPFQFNQSFFMPQISLVDGVKQPGNDFMEIVFEQLGPGEIGVAPNQPRSEFYVVQVRERDAAMTPEGDDLALRAFQQQFLREGREEFRNPAYDVLAQIPLAELQRRWQEDFEKRFNVVWNEEAADERRAREP
jgi:hypothetical protein